MLSAALAMTTNKFLTHLLAQASHTKPLNTMGPSIPLFERGKVGTMMYGPSVMLTLSHTS